MKPKLTYVFAYDDEHEDNSHHMLDDLILDIFPEEDDIIDIPYYIGKIRVTFMGPGAADIQGLDVREAKDNTRAEFEKKYGIKVIYPQ